MARKSLILGIALTAAVLVGAVTGILQPDEKRRRRRAARPILRFSVDQQAATDAISEEVRRLRPDLDEVEIRFLTQAVLAWSMGESGLGRNLQGDLQWATLRPAQYRRLVLEEPAYAANPFRGDPAAWTSYGLFHQLAAVWLKVAIARGLVPADAHPNVLANPSVSVRLGVPMVFELLSAERDHGWPEAFIRARLTAKGCGPDGSRCDAATVARARANAQRVLEQFLVWGPGPLPESLEFEGVA